MRVFAAKPTYTFAASMISQAATAHGTTIEKILRRLRYDTSTIGEYSPRYQTCTIRIDRRTWNVRFRNRAVRQKGLQKRAERCERIVVNQACPGDSGHRS
jgi:hypothetical protein